MKDTLNMLYEALAMRMRTLSSRHVVFNRAHECMKTKQGDQSKYDGARTSYLAECALAEPLVEAFVKGSYETIVKALNEHLSGQIKTADASLKLMTSSPPASEKPQKSDEERPRRGN